MLISWMRRLLAVAERVRPFKLILEGPPQTGKTFFGKVIAEEIGGANPLPVFKLSCSDSMRPEELFFSLVAPGNKVRYQYSPILEAFEASRRGPVVLIVDEFDKTRQRAEDLFLSAFEDWRFRLPTGEVVTAEPRNMLVVIASNARRRLREETLRRFPFRLVVGFPSREDQIAILQELDRSIPSNVAGYLVKLATKLREVDAFKAPSYGELIAVYQGALALGGDRKAIEEILTGSLWKDSGEEPPIPWRWAKGLVAEMREAGLISNGS